MPVPVRRARLLGVVHTISYRMVGCAALFICVYMDSARPSAYPWNELSCCYFSQAMLAGNAKVSKKSTLTCYANSFAQVWGQTVAEAWILSECDASSDTYLCKDECDGYPSCKRCKAEAYTEATAWAEATLKVDVGNSGDCLQNTTETFDEVVTINYPTDHTGRVRRPHNAFGDDAKSSEFLFAYQHGCNSNRCCPCFNVVRRN